MKYIILLLFLSGCAEDSKELLPTIEPRDIKIEQLEKELRDYTKESAFNLHVLQQNHIRLEDHFNDMNYLLRYIEAYSEDETSVCSMNIINVINSYKKWFSSKQKEQEAEDQKMQEEKDENDRYKN